MLQILAFILGLMVGYLIVTSLIKALTKKVNKKTQRQLEFMALVTHHHFVKNMDLSKADMKWINETAQNLLAAHDII